MSKKCDQAVELFNSGFNCCQAVLAVFCEGYGLDRTTALKLACGFGGGVRSGEICGAASGAVMVIGLKTGHCEAADMAAKSNCYAKTVQFLDAFRARNRSVVCREILGCDISTKAGYAKAHSAGLFGTTCVDMVAGAVEILERLGY